MLNVGFYGFGYIGRLIAKIALERGFNIIGVVDIDPSIVGRDIGEVLGLSDKLGVVVSSRVDSIKGSDVVFHATGSYLDKVYDQIVSILGIRADVLSTCETLAYPYYRYPILARRLDELAIKNNVSILGTGINPGFLLDTLVIILSAPFNSIVRVEASRSLDAAKRREPFRRKIGLGLDIDTARRKMESGELTGHVGYAESVLLIADALSINLAKIIEAQEPIVADSDIESSGVKIQRGYVKGVRGYGVGYANNREVIRVEFKAYVGADEYEDILIEGSSYSIRWRSTGTPGDMGTAAVLVNLAERIGDYGPGLLTMTDLIPFKSIIK
ncbi:MAG: hypothetical protein QXO93_02610 [Acidilobaceae archaeon]